MHSKTYFGKELWDIWKEDYQKSSENLTSFFMEIFMRKKICGSSSDRL